MFTQFQLPGKYALCLVRPPNSKLLEVRKTGVIRNDTQMAAEYPFKLAEYDIQHKMQAIFRLHATVQTAFWGIDCIRMYTTPMRQWRLLWIQTIIQQFSPTWKNKVRTKAWQSSWRKSRIWIKLGKFGIMLQQCSSGGSPAVRMRRLGTPMHIVTHKGY